MKSTHQNLNIFVSSVRHLTSFIMKILFTAAFMWFGFVSRSQTLVVHFDFAKSDLTTAGKYSIDSFMATKKNKLAGQMINLSGHCDAIGTTGYNDNLSLRRIETVKKYLEGNYLDTGMISTLNAYGERKPLNKNKTEKDRLENRRVEITVLPKESAQVPAPKKESPQLSAPKAKSLKETLADTATKPGTRIILRNINFLLGLHQFSPGTSKSLEELLDAMKAFPKLIIELHGHICCSPTTDDSYDSETGTHDLSLQRAIAVKKYLVDNGIDPNRISCRGIGHFNPIYPFPEKNEFERQENRRVEIQVIRK